MFTTDSIIDTVQNTKKTLVNTLVTNDVVKEALVKFIDAQTDYTKKAMKTGMDTITALTTETVKAGQDAVKFDYVRFGEGIMKAYSAQANQFR